MEATNKSIQEKIKTHSRKLNKNDISSCSSGSGGSNNPDNTIFLCMFFGFISFLAGYHVKRITSS